MCLLESAQTLTGLYLPHLDLAVARARGEHLRVAAVGQAEHGVLHHHEVLLRLVLEILAYLARGEVPHLDEAVHRARDQVLAVGREAHHLGVRLLAHLDLLVEHGRIRLLDLFAHRRLAAKQVDGRARRQQALILLPLERLAEQREQARRRHGAHLARQRVRY